MQLSQVGQQTQATGNFVQALAIQLPDIGLAFGTIGTAVGLLVGIALPSIVNAFRQTEDVSKDVDEQMSELSATTDQLTKLLALQAGDAEKLAAAYGLIAAEARVLNEIGIAAAAQDQREALSTLLETIAAGASGVDEFDAAMRMLQESLGETRGLSAQAGAFFAQLPADLRLGVLEVRELAKAAADSTTSVEDLRKRAAALVVSLEAIDDVGFNSLIQNLLGIVTTLADVDAAARGTAETLHNVNALRFELLADGNVDFLDPRGETQIGGTRPNRQPPSTRPGRSGGGGGGGGGASEVDKLASEFERLRGQIDPTWRALQQYTQAVETLDAALAGGLIQSQEDYDELLAQVETRFTSMGELAQSVGQTIENAMTDAFMGIIDGTLDADEAFKQMAASIISELFRVLVVQQLVGSFESGGGGLLGGLFSLIGRADGGNVDRNVPHLVGERGPELFVPNSSGHIVPNGAGGGVTIVQKNTFQSGVTRQEVASMLPQLAETAKNAVRDDMQRRPSQWGSR